MANPYTSERLLYRAAEPTDAPFFEAIATDVVGHQNSNSRFAVPQSKKDAAEYLRYVSEDALLGVVICLPSSSSSNTTDSTTTQSTPADATPIGTVHLKAIHPRQQHRRQSEIGIGLLPAYQGQGYGSEAIRWTLRWAFVTMGLHRVQIRALGYNERARRLYESLGFQPEGRWRESLWFQGRWWDDFQFAMLDREWWEKENSENAKAGKAMG